MSSPFKYSDYDWKRIRATLARAGIEKSPQWFKIELETSANFYLGMVEWSRIQPDQKHLEERHLADLAAMHRVRTLIEGRCPDLPAVRLIPKPLAEDETEIAFMNEVRATFERFNEDKISGITMLNELAVRALDIEIQDAECFGSIDNKLRDGRKKSHRASFVKWIAQHWAILNAKKVEDCTISAAYGSPMLEFVKACLEPVTAVSGEGAGNETIKNIVNSYRDERRNINSAHTG